MKGVFFEMSSKYEEAYSEGKNSEGEVFTSARKSSFISDAVPGNEESSSAALDLIRRMRKTHYQKNEKDSP